jgi:hypothetical protein
LDRLDRHGRFLLLVFRAQLGHAAADSGLRCPYLGGVWFSDRRHAGGSREHSRCGFRGLFGLHGWKGCAAGCGFVRWRMSGGVFGALCIASDDQFDGQFDGQFNDKRKASLIVKV